MSSLPLAQTMIRTTTHHLQAPSQQQRQNLLSLEKTIAAHDAMVSTLACMNEVEIGGAPSRSEPLAFPFHVTAWNLERGLFPEQSAQKMLAAQPALALLSELDQGMARTAQHNIIAELARLMQMNYAYAVEFIELGLGSQAERQFCHQDFNDKGFHGNGLMAKIALQQVFALRLAGERLWFLKSGEEPRLGERNAIGAVIETTQGPFIAVSVHLESAANAAYRENQLKQLIDMIEGEFAAMPLLIGGDMNSGNHIGGDFEAEGLFALAQQRGFSRHSGRLDQMTTRPSLITRWPERAMKLDWFLSRGLVIGDSQIIPSLDESGTPLSDHDLIQCRIDGFTAPFQQR